MVRNRLALRFSFPVIMVAVSGGRALADTYIWSGLGANSSWNTTGNPCGVTPP